jgi:protein-S-isoprenylcysteine O-methyltransferase Ste14
MPIYAYAILVVGWLLWLTPFLRARKTEQPAKQVDRRARWGILLVGISYCLLWQGRFWERSPRPWQIVLSILFFALASLLSWTVARALGRQWRIDAGLSADHELITSGPYRFVRHPIYSSLLCVLLGTGFLITPWWLLLPALLLFIIGTEIRVRIEDHLLASHFGERFTEYRQRVPAYIPFLK